MSKTSLFPAEFAEYTESFAQSFRSSLLNPQKACVRKLDIKKDAGYFTVNSCKAKRSEEIYPLITDFLDLSTSVEMTKNLPLVISTEAQRSGEIYTNNAEWLDVLLKESGFSNFHYRNRKHV